MNGRGPIVGVVIGVIGVAVAVVALVIGINAKNGNQSDQELADSVQRQVNSQLTQLGLKQGTAAKHAKQAEQNLSARQRQQQAAQRRAQRRLAGGQAVTQNDIAGINRRLNTIAADVKRITNEQRVIRGDIRNLDNRVGKLERQQNRGK
jgi:hypothetical protein